MKNFLIVAFTLYGTISATISYATKPTQEEVADLLCLEESEITSFIVC